MNRTRTAATHRTSSPAERAETSARIARASERQRASNAGDTSAQTDQKVDPESAPRAYSYLRFSTPEQSKGDSLHRQTKLAQDYCDRHGLQLDTNLTYQDLGVSAFRGRNAEEGRLGDFLAAVTAGDVPTGSFLLVESLDRVSRTTPRKAVRILEGICEAGVNVVTLSDGKVYNVENLDNDGGMSLIMSVLIFVRANEESATKSKRVGAARATARRNAIESKTPITAKCPGWLKLDREAGRFLVLEDRAEVVRRIYRDTIAGKGQHAIAQAFNVEGVPTFGSAGHWQKSYVFKILKSHAVIGKFTTHKMEKTKEGKTVRTPQATIPGYFPSVVSKKDWALVRSMEQKGRKVAQRGTKAAEVRNLFGGLMRCTCGKAVTVTYKGGRSKPGYRYLNCTARLDKLGCDFKPLRYDLMEGQFLQHSDEVLAYQQHHSAETKLRQEREDAEAGHDAICDAINNLVTGMERGGRSLSITQRIAVLEAEKTEVSERLKSIESRQEASAPKVVLRRVTELKEAMRSEPMDRARVNVLLRQIFSIIRLDRTTGRACFVWKAGAESPLLIEFPKED